MAFTATITDLDIKPTSVTYADVVITDKEGKTEIKATQNTKQIEKAKLENALLFEQSFSYDLPGTIKGILDLPIPDEEKVIIFRQGYTAKINRGIVALLEEVDESGNPVFQPVEGNYDARPIGAEISGRVRLTETEKAMRTVSNLSPEVKAQLLLIWQQQLSAQKSPEATSAQ